MYRAIVIIALSDDSLYKSRLLKINQIKITINEQPPK